MKLLHSIKIIFLILILTLSVKSENFRSFSEIQEGQSENDESNQIIPKNFILSTFTEYYNHVSSAISNKVASEARGFKKKLQDLAHNTGENIKNYLSEKMTINQ